ncbi:GIY-YIG nuclease family protein [Paraneptunicella aestuarii]|uniref:GIY-YIG nuclease family protein n=1 Tax=Paraneptunicella aestuarii TaxID=2831148 RepID=UPI001E41D3AC|nr:GIY-YIG nuclease family protein [Paraneptunicella aestuarii]UAA39926.1 GIY-YIG nuclease family protein [Paraneptunicella aestuarii]
MNSATDKWFVYIVQCADSTLYTGIAKDVAARIDKHNAGTGAKYTRTRRPVVDVYREEAASRSEASKREMQIKALSRKEKLVLIAEN